MIKGELEAISQIELVNSDDVFLALWLGHFPGLTNGAIYEDG